MAESKSKEEIMDTKASIDRLSSLPNELLLKILSYLPVRQAVATSILSNTWRSLSLSRHSFHLDDAIDAPYIRSLQFLEKNYSRFAHFDDDFALICPRPQNCIRLKRRIPCSNPSGITQWVETAIQRQVEILDVSLRTNVISLSPTVFTSSSIVILRLNCMILNGSDFDSVCLPSLKILHLKSVAFCSLETMRKLLLGSSMILEDLALKNITFIFRQPSVVSCSDYCKSFPKLIRANVDANTFIPLDSILNVESLRILPDFYRFYGRFVYGDSQAFQNLVFLEVEFYDCWWQFLDNMLQYTPKLQNLVISKKLGGRFRSWINNLKLVPECLSSYLRTCYIKGFDSKESSLACVLPFAKYVVENGRVLETMTISCINPITKNLIDKKLLSWKRSSPACQVKIE